MLNKKQLKARGWTDALIRKFYPNKNCCYSLKKVEEIENSFWFKYEMIQTNTRRERANAAIQCKNIIVNSLVV